MTERNITEYEVNLHSALEALVASGHMTQDAATTCFHHCMRNVDGTNELVDWNEVQDLDPTRLFPEPLPSNIQDDEARLLLSQVVILKLNGGLGTTMGCRGPKTAIVAKNGMTFLEIFVKQVKFLNEKYGTDVPLVLMNSDVTDTMTRNLIRNLHLDTGVDIHYFMQNLFPRLDARTMLPLADVPPGSTEFWYPPGHGDAIRSFVASGLARFFYDQGKRYLFVSNGDNLGATLDLQLLKTIISTGRDMIMEVTPKTQMDVKGGTLISYHGHTKLLEVAQVPPEHIDDFCGTRRFSVFNTNNIWLNLDAMIKNPHPALPLIKNRKIVAGREVIQLETAIGAAIETYGGAGIIVSRRRFVPVKNTGDLLVLRSDVFTLEPDFTLRQTTPSRPFIELSPHYSTIDALEKLVPSVPSIREAVEVRLQGAIRLGPRVALRGNVQIVAPGEYDIPEDTILDDIDVTIGNR